MVLPPKLESLQFLSGGAVAKVYRLNDFTVVKCPWEQGSASFDKENRFYDLFDQHGVCPDVVRSFLRVPQANFLSYCSGGTLEDRLRPRQTRNTRQTVINVTQHESCEITAKWTIELSNAAAWLESLGYGHCDIRPPNLLLDHKLDLKLSDFDCASKLGTISEGGAPPYARLLGDEGGSDRGTFGLVGSRTEQFAIGSILYYMTRGYEPYADEDLGDDHGPIVVDRLQGMIFPALGEGKFDETIGRCWRGDFYSMKDLSIEAQRLSSTYVSRRHELTDEVFREQRAECQKLIDAGLINSEG